MAKSKQHELFICYSHTDREYREQFSNFLQPLRDMREMRIFSDVEIKPGENWRKRISDHLQSATAALLLVSQEFMISRFIQQVELRELLEAQIRRGLRLFLVPVRSMNYQGTYLEQFQWARPPDQPLALLTNEQQRQAMVQICVTIKNELSDRTHQPSAEHTIKCLRSVPKLDLPPTYEVGEPVGVGEFARCYSARDRLMARDVIIKVLNTELTLDSPAYDKYVRSATQLNHRNILGVLFSQANKLPHFIVTPKIKGRTLRERLDRVGRSSPPTSSEALDYAITLADTLAYAHVKGCLHGRLRPSEIRFDPEQGPMLSGFRTLKLLKSDPSPASGASMTLEEFVYASPEQRKGVTPDQKSDQYLLGLVTYEMIAGRLPAAVANWASVLNPEVMGRLLNPPPLKEYARGCDARVSDVIMKMLAVDPAARWNSLDTVKRKLEDARASIAVASVDVAKESYRRCAQGTEFYQALYANLFETVPQVRKMFTQPTLARQYQVLRHALWLLLTFPATQEQEDPTILSGIARTHTDVTPAQYDAFRDAVLETVKKHDSPNPALINAWREAMQPGFDYLKARGKQHRRKA